MVRLRTPPRAARPASTPNYRVSVISPAYGAAITGSSLTIKICAPGMGNVWARSWHEPDATHTDPKGYDKRFFNVAPNSTGYAEITFPASDFPRGPIAVLIDAWDGVEGGGTYTVTDTAYLQLYNTNGTSWKEGAPAGAPRQPPVRRWCSRTTSTPLSINRTGARATYASSKPDAPNGTEFGDGIFDDYGGANNPFA